MGTLKISYNLIFRICALIGLIVFAYIFPDIILYFFLAFICTLIGKPIAAAIGKIRIFKRTLPRSICTVLTLLIFISLMLLSILFFVPSLVKELKVLDNLDYNKIIANLNIFFNEVQDFLYEKNFLESNQTLGGVIESEIKKWVHADSISHMISGFVSSTSSFLFGLFVVFFVSFFFIKDNLRIENALQLFFNRKYVPRLTQVVENINHLLSRYFIGLVIKTAIMTLLLYIGFALFGVKGAILMALIGGITNIIPYLGPFIGWGIVIVFGLINCIGNGMYSDILPILVKISITFISANVVDNLVLGPVIYSQSIKAHPLEVFLVTILGGRIAGMAGMVLAIPVYTIIRIALIEIYHYVTEKDSEDNETVLIGKDGD